MSTALELNIIGVRGELSRLQRSISMAYSWLQLLEADRAGIALGDLAKFEADRNAQAVALLAALKAESSATSNTALAYRLNAILNVTGMG